MTITKHIKIKHHKTTNLSKGSKVNCEFPLIFNYYWPYISLKSWCLIIWILYINNTQVYNVQLEMSSDLNKMFSLKDFCLVACTKAYSNWSLKMIISREPIVQTKLHSCPLFNGLYKNIDQIGPWREPWRAFFWQGSPRISLLKVK